MDGSVANEFRRLFRRLTTGVSLIAVAGDDGPTGMTVNSLTPVSLDPPLLLFCARRASKTAELIGSVRTFSVNLLTDRQEDVSAHHAGRPLRHATWRWGEHGGVPWIVGANANFICRLVSQHDGGDHRILVGQIDRMFGPETAETPLLYHGGAYARLPFARSIEPRREQPNDDLWWTG